MTSHVLFAEHYYLNPSPTSDDNAEAIYLGAYRVLMDHTTSIPEPENTIRIDLIEMLEAADDCTLWEKAQMMSILGRVLTIDESFTTAALMLVHHCDRSPNVIQSWSHDDVIDWWFRAAVVCLKGNGIDVAAVNHDHRIIVPAITPVTKNETYS